MSFYCRQVSKLDLHSLLDKKSQASVTLRLSGTVMCSYYTIIIYNSIINYERRSYDDIKVPL